MLFSVDTWQLAVNSACFSSYWTVTCLRTEAISLLLSFFSSTMWHTRSQLSDQGLNPHPLWWKQNLNHWTTREVPVSHLFNGPQYELRASLVAPWQRICHLGRSHRGCVFNPWVRKIPWRRAWQPTPVFLPGESPCTEDLASYSPQDHIESDTNEMT